MAIVTEVGATLRHYSVDGEPLLHGFAADERASGGRGQLLAPWPNRLKDGSYRFDGQDYHLPLSEPDRHNAIHGLVRWAAWAQTAASDDAVELSHVVYPQPGYDFTLSLCVRYQLQDSGLSVTARARNIGQRPLPYGLGAHPYLMLGEPPVDHLVLTCPATSRLETDERQIPTGRLLPVDGTDFDFRAPRRIAGTVLDTAFTDFELVQGELRVEVERPETGAKARLWADSSHRFLMLFTGDSLPQDQRRRGLGVEPMTCAPNALQSGDGLVTLEPGQDCVSSWGITRL